MHCGVCEVKLHGMCMIFMQLVIMPCSPSMHAIAMNLQRSCMHALHDCKK